MSDCTHSAQGWVTSYLREVVRHVVRKLHLGSPRFCVRATHAWQVLFSWMSLVGLTLGCGQKKPEAVIRYDVSEEFQPYIDEYERVAASEGRDVTITNLIVGFGPTPSLMHTAICEVTEGQPPKIVVNRSVWTRLTSTGHKVVMFHELGHCHLRRVHRNEFVSGTAVPVSLMYQFRVGDSTYHSHEEDFNNELFSRYSEF